VSRPRSCDQAAAGHAGAVAALAGMRQMGPRRLMRLLRHHCPHEAYEVVRGNAQPALALRHEFNQDLWSVWRAEAIIRTPEFCGAQCAELGIEVLAYGDPGYPALLLYDPLPPAALFYRGRLDALGERRVGVIGTRNPTRSGLDTARTLGEELGHAQVAVVSGLAKGIDGAAHRGSLEGSGVPIAVVGNGLDRAYPSVHRALWSSVADHGLLLSEWPPGVAPEAFRFPLRNRVLAALSEVIVVVESRERGGSLSTVREAADRGVQVMAVPGSVRTRASAGTNQLLCDGVAPVTCTEDVLMALGLDTRRRGNLAFDSRPVPDALGARVLGLCRSGPRTLDDVVVALELTVAQAAMALARLEHSGWVGETAGWFEVLGPWASRPGSEHHQEFLQARSTGDGA
jgi:DNA processing protein